MVALSFKPCTAPVVGSKRRGSACAEVATMQIRKSASWAASRGVFAAVEAALLLLSFRKRSRAGGKMS